MKSYEEISSVGRLLCPTDDVWEEAGETFVDDSCVHCMTAAPADDIEEIESVRTHLHAAVDQVVNRAVKGLSDLTDRLMVAEKGQQDLSEVLDYVVRESNKRTLAAAPALPKEAEPRARRDTLPDRPRRRTMPEFPGAFEQA